MRLKFVIMMLAIIVGCNLSIDIPADEPIDVEVVEAQTEVHFLNAPSKVIYLSPNGEIKWWLPTHEELDPPYYEFQIEESTVRNSQIYITVIRDGNRIGEVGWSVNELLDQTED